MRLTIYGAGLAGLLAANALRRYSPRVFEAQASLPHNHDALLRFRSDAVARATGIPFRKVRVQKGIYLYGKGITTTPDLRSNNLYSLKVTGEFMDRSIGNLDTVERWIAPTNLISLLAQGLDIHYGEGLTGVSSEDKEPKITTIPMPVLMKIVGWRDKPPFAYRAVTVLTFDINKPKTDVYQTLYFPEPEILYYRVSITGRHVMIEIPGESLLTDDRTEIIAQEALSRFGLAHQTIISTISCKVQWFGKISPISENVRKSFIMEMSDRYNLYSLGRYATWRNILLDDVVHDLQIVESMITQRDSYQNRLTQLK